MISDPFAPILQYQGFVLLDGALATELERRGADLNDPLWSARVLLENPDLIRQVHLDYFRAGANVATTASYQASFSGLAARGLDQARAAAVLRRSVEVTQEAREQFLQENPATLPPLIAASIGCYGAALHDGSEYRGDYGLSKRQLIDWHRPRLEALLEAKPDLLALETIPCLIEAEALVEMLGHYPDVRAWLSCSCRDGRHLCHGEPFENVIALANDAANFVAVGVNCTAPWHVEELLGRAAGSSKHVLAYPNSGEEWDAIAQAWKPAPRAFDWPAAARRRRAAGAKLIGGCCRTTPATIAALATSLP